MVNPGHHYGPNVDGYEYDRWGTYTRLIGRQSGWIDPAGGTGFAGQYHQPNASMNPGKVPRGAAALLTGLVTGAASVWEDPDPAHLRHSLRRWSRFGVLPVGTLGGRVDPETFVHVAPTAEQLKRHGVVMCHSYFTAWHPRRAGKIC